MSTNKYSNQFAKKRRVATSANLKLASNPGTLPNQPGDNATMFILLTIFLVGCAVIGGVFYVVLQP